MTWQWQGKTYETRAALDEAKRRHYEAVSAGYRARRLAKQPGGTGRPSGASNCGPPGTTAGPGWGREGGGRTPPQPAPEVTPPRSAVLGKPEEPDDLTRIRNRNVGKGIQLRLNRGGVCTFEQLARLTPDEFEDLTGVSVELVRRGRHIEQARELAKEARSGE